MTTVRRRIFEENNYRKIKKKLIYEKLARIKEIADIILFKNINLNTQIKFRMIFFWKLQKILTQSLQEIFRSIFKKNY